jgi:hypothetical protein
MSTSWYRRLVRFMAGPMAAIGVIGGAMGMSAIAHAHAGPTAARITVSQVFARQ